MTFNKEKCQFGVTELEFYGYKFTKDGLKPTQDKVQAVKQCNAPESKEAVRSLGMKQAIESGKKTHLGTTSYALMVKLLFTMKVVSHRCQFLTETRGSAEAQLNLIFLKMTI